VGVGTVVADDPLLTDRSGLPRRRPLLRIVLDSTLRTPLTAKLVAGAQQDVLIFFKHATTEHQQAFRDRGVQLHQVSPADGLLQILQSLGKMQMTSVLLEGGAKVHTEALNQGLVDRLMLFYAPIFMGQQALSMLGQLNQLPPLERYELKQFAEDFALEAYLRDPWTSVTPAINPAVIK
jgi:diaminohydroxyphosphoribosylaminopyrimidine deaminase/5-amino-6-(5-phosphoribosylamino)uracil reductase